MGSGRISGCQERGAARGGGGGLTPKGWSIGEFGRGSGLVLYHDCGGSFTIVFIGQNSQNLTQKRMKFITCKLYLH